MVPISSSNTIDIGKTLYVFLLLFCHIVQILHQKIERKNGMKRNWQTKKVQEKERKRISQLQMILSVEQSIKIFHANAVIQHTDLTTCKPNFKQRHRIINGFQNACKCDVNVCMCACTMYLYCTCCVHSLNGKQFSNESAWLAKPPFNRSTLIFCGDGAVTFYTS